MRRTTPFDPTTRSHTLYARNVLHRFPRSLAALAACETEEDVDMMLLATHHALYEHFEDRCTMLN